MSIQTYYFYQSGSIPNVPGTFAAGTAVDIDTSTLTVVATRPIGSTVPVSVLLTTTQATGSTSATLQNGATATGTGTTLSTLGMGTVAFTVTGTFSAIITWEGSEDGLNFFPILATSYGSTTPATTTTATGIFIAECVGLQQVRAHITSYTSGNVTVTAHAVPLSGTGSSAGGGGAVTIADGANVAQGATTDVTWSGSGNGTEIAILKKLAIQLAATLGVQQTDLTTTGTISAAQPSINTPVSNATVTLAVAQGQSTWKAQLLAGGGGFTGSTTIVADKSPDGGTTWYSASFKVAGGTTTVSSVVGPGPLELTGNVAGVSHVRIRCSVLNSTETIAVTLRGGAGVSEVGLLSSIPAGTNTIGAVTQASGPWTQNLTQINGTALSNTNPVPSQDIEQSGYVTASSPPAQTNAGSDTSYTFSSQVNRVIIQNNTSVNLNYAFDTAASAGSFLLVPGATLVYPKKCTVLHLYTSTAQSINGTSSGNIVVLGAL
jgi:hypothetical protein